MGTKSFILIVSLFTIGSIAVAQAPKQIEAIVTTPMGPTQTIDQTQMIVASFNQSMVPLREVPVDESSGPLIIDPAVRGKYRWQGTQTISFIPSTALPYSTEYTVRIPAATASLSGRTIGRDIVWKFETPRPRVISNSPENNQRFVELDHAIVLRFNQPVDPQIVSRWISVEEHSGGQVTYLRYTSSRPENPKEVSKNTGVLKEEPENTVVLKPVETMKKGASYTVRCKAGLTGTEGALGMVNDYVFNFSTYSEFSFIEVMNGQPMSPTQSLHLRFSNPVWRKDVVEHLKLTPDAAKESEEYEEYSPSNELYISLQLQPETKYVGIISPGLKDRFGNILNETVRFTFTTGSYPSSVRMTTGPGVLEAYQAHRYPVVFTNIESVGLSLGRINPDKFITIMQRLDYSYSWELAWKEAILDWGDRRSEDTSTFSLTKTWRPGVPRNKPTERDINLDAVLGESKLGMVLAQVDYHNPETGKQRYLKALVQVTNIGVTAKFSPNNNLIWVTRLKDARPIEGATVEVRNDSNAVLWKGVTDADGCAKGPGWGKLVDPNRNAPHGEGDEENEEEWYEPDQPRQWVVVRYKGDVAVTNSEWNEGLQPWTFGVPIEWRPEYEPMEGELFTDRGLYRAGEQVDIKGIVRIRREESWRIPSSVPLRLTIRDSRNDNVYSEMQALSGYGSFTTSLILKPSAPLGYYSMRLESRIMSKGKEKWKAVAWNSFRVEAFRPAEFQVTAQIAKKSAVIGDTIDCLFSGKYLFGAAMQKAPVTWRSSISPALWQPEGYDDYFFGELGWLGKYHGSRYRSLSKKDTVLDKFGNLPVRTILNVGEVTGTVSLTLEADVQSPSRQAIAGRGSVIVHGGEYYIGLAPSSTFVESGKALRYKIITITPEGKTVAGGSLDGKIFKRIWHSVRKAETGGRYYWQSETEDITMDSSVVVSKGETIEQSYTPKEPGFYFMRYTGKDARGNVVMSEAYFYASGSDYVPWERMNDDRIELIANKKNYKVGETASIIVKSPYEKATALVSMERHGIIRHFVTTLVGSAPQIDLPLGSNELPNVFVSVVLLQGRVAPPADSREADVGRPSFKIGYISLSVSPLEKKLDVTVKPEKAEYRPGDMVEATITTKDHSGRAVSAEVALSVADLGVLNLINYRLPDPFRSFYRHLSLAVVTTETRLNLVKQRNYDEKGEDDGGGGGDENAPGYDAEGIRKLFKPSAYWNPSIITGGNGTARITFKLPDNLTSFEIMAVAQTKESDFGYGENSFRVSKPLLMQPALPRFARLGDSFEGGVLLLNYSDREKQVRLVTVAQGLASGSSDTVMVLLKAGEGKEVRRSYRAEELGNAVLTFIASSDADRDGLQWKIPVQMPRLRETAALFESSTENLSKEQTTVPKDIYPDLGNIEVTLSSTAMVGLEKGIQYLFDYPYGCLEQRLSCALPIIMARDLVEAFQFESLKGKNYRGAAEKVLDEIPAFQRGNGGFAYWKNTDYVCPYLSVYAMYTLVQAQRAGYEVDKTMIDDGFRFLQEVLDGKHGDFWYDEDASDCTRAFTLYTFALAGKPKFGLMENLYARRDVMPLFARAYLLKALSVSGGNPTMIAELARDLANMAKVAPTSAHYEEKVSSCWAWLYHSDVRTTALVMQALVETQPENPVIPKVVRWLIDRQKMGRWRSTQENLYVVDALATYFRKYENETPNFKAQVLLEGGKLLESFFNGRSLKTATGAIGIKELQPGMTYNWEFIKDGTGRLYRTVKMNYYRQGETIAKEEGISVLKAITDPQRPDSSLTSMKAGTVAKVTITIATTQARNFVVVDDPIPAGVEIVDRTFQTTGSEGFISEKSSEERWHWNPFQHREFYDDRALFFADYLPAGIHTITYVVRATRYGTFEVPSTRAEGMYEPEVFGQTSSKRFSVK